MRRLWSLGVTVHLLTASMAEAVLAQAQWPEVQGKGICNTQSGWCPLPDPDRTPVGAACYCIMPGNTLVYGITTSQRYFGRVNPYFNAHPQPVPSTIK
jgi:hypothetical protein